MPPEAAAAALRRLAALLLRLRWRLAAGALAAWLLRRLPLVWKMARIPGPAIPLLGLSPLGHLGTFLRAPKIAATRPPHPDMMAMYEDWMQEGAAAGHGLFKVWFFHPLMPVTFPMIQIHEPSLAREILASSNFGKFRKGRSYRMAQALIGRTALLASPDNDYWDFQRRLCKQGFGSEVFRSVVPATAGAIADLSARWDAEGAAAGPVAVNFAEEALKLTMDVLGKVAFSRDFGSVRCADAKDAPLFSAFDYILKYMANPIIGLMPSKRRKFHRCMATLDGIVDRMVTERRGGAPKGDLLGQLLSATDDEAGGGEASGLSAGALKDNLKTFLFAGHDTTASALAWALHILADPQHDRVAERLRGEVCCAPADAPPTWAELERFEYLGAFVNELLRVHPSAGFTREALRDTRLGADGPIIPAGVEVFIFPYLVHRHPGAFDAPHEFRPERWLAGGDARGAEAYMPFSLGRRNCIGQFIALTELRTALVCLLRRYCFEPHPDAPEVRPVLGFTLAPNKVLLRITRAGDGGGRAAAAAEGRASPNRRPSAGRLG